MKRIVLLFCLPLMNPLFSKAAWSPVEGAMLTEWGEKVTPQNAWREYPRPQMVREDWSNLNGLWNFAITKRGAEEPEEWNGEILVPFAVETPLSGVGKRLEEEEVIWYQREFSLRNPGNDRTLLHFEGVDYACQVWVNGQAAGSHVGGNLPFGFDITDLVKGGRNQVVLRIVDDTDSFDRYQLRGKQKRDNSGIWYSPSSGIWQTVWLETVPQTYLADIKLLADMHGRLQVDAKTSGSPRHGLHLRVSVMDAGSAVAATTSRDTQASLVVSPVERWSPDNPKLYELKIELLSKDGEVLDSVESYTGFRSIGKQKDAEGHWRFVLNGEEIFQLGPLDQGWWPDGFLNPPADEAIQFEMVFLKQAGFNMIRKHKKVEPRRYYYHADRMGFVVWQDHVSGGVPPNEWPKWKRLESLTKGYEPKNPRHWQSEEDNVEADWPDWAHAQFMSELKTMIDVLHNHPCVVVWTTFNERWGQHRSLEIGAWVQRYDPSRLLNIASGGNFFPIGDIADQHNYPSPTYPLDVPLYHDYIKVVGEFGGHGWLVEGHQWSKNQRNWGYGGLPQSLEEYKERYRTSSQMLGELKKQGIAAGVYTQTTDVEGELNGLMTYDRKVLKLSTGELREIHAGDGLLD